MFPILTVVFILLSVFSDCFYAETEFGVVPLFKGFRGTFQSFLIASKDVGKPGVHTWGELLHIFQSFFDCFKGVFPRA